jgi:glycosyltransferase involved in cell wall biosynthesis
VCSVQDTIQLDVDGYLRFGVRTRVQFLNARRADVVVANSHHTAQRISHHLARDVSEVPVCPLPVNPVFTQAPLELDAALDPVSAAAFAEGPYVVAMADYRTPDPRKRFHWIQDLGRALQGTGITLVVACRALEPRTSRSGEIYLYDLDDAALVALYGNALAFFYPSAYEGQGLPPLEAMAAGCPVIAFRNSSVTEVVGADEFLLEDPIPWQAQSLDLGLPPSVAREVVARLAAWAGDEPSHATVRQLARAKANRWSAQNLAAALDGAYERARELCPS